jgi:multisubunit Na+/H+ antiporter MnhE subunit
MDWLCSRDRFTLVLITGSRVFAARLYPRSMVYFETSRSVGRWIRGVWFLCHFLIRLQGASTVVLNLIIREAATLFNTILAVNG